MILILYLSNSKTQQINNSSSEYIRHACLSNYSWRRCSWFSFPLGIQVRNTNQERILPQALSDLKSKNVRTLLGKRVYGLGSGIGVLIKKSWPKPALEGASTEDTQNCLSRENTVSISNQWLSETNSIQMWSCLHKGSHDATPFWRWNFQISQGTNPPSFPCRKFRSNGSFTKYSLKMMLL